MHLWLQLLFFVAARQRAACQVAAVHYELHQVPGEISHGEDEK